MFTRSAPSYPFAVMFVLGAAVPVLTGCRKDAAGPERLPIESRFTRNAENWTVAGDGSLSHSSTDGNPGGYIFTEDRVNGPSMYFVAPSRYYGDRADAYGLRLAFDMMWASGEDANEVPDQVSVILQGGGLTIVAFIAEGPGAAWRPYSLRLDETGGWVHQASSQPVTAAEIQQLLGSLQQIRIRAEFNEGQETTGLDNVVLGI